MDIENKSGIYCIYFEQDNNKYYIGCSLNIKKRINDHVSMLNMHKHHNYKIQSLYNKYGIPIFEVLEYCGADVLFQLEIQYINEFDSFNTGLNLTIGGNGRLFGESNPLAVYTKDKYMEVVSYLAHTDITYSEIEQATAVSRNTIKHIASLSSHLYLEQEMPEEYKILRAKLGNRPDNSAKSKGIVYPQIVCPNGRVYTIDNLTKFAEQHQLQPQNLHKVLNKKRNHHKGWKIHES